MKDWMWWIAVPALILLVLGLVGALGLLLDRYPWMNYILLLGGWLGVMQISKLGRSTLLKLSAAGVVIGAILGTAIVVTRWLSGTQPFQAVTIVNFAFYFGVSLPVLFNLGYVKGKYGMP